MNMTVRTMEVKDISLIGTVDRSETVAALYVARRSSDGLSLSLRRVEQDPPIARGPWSREGVERRLTEWRPQLERGGVLLGAFGDEQLVGFAILGPKRSDESAELCAIFVAAGHRRAGIGSLLMEEVERQARERGVRSLLVFSNPTASAVDFYLKQGCSIVSLVDKTLVRDLPWDVVLAKEL
jgi:GNAT superfamily N-acetyltransferase